MDYLLAIVHATRHAEVLFSGEHARRTALTKAAKALALVRDRNILPARGHQGTCSGRPIPSRMLSRPRRGRKASNRPKGGIHDLLESIPVLPDAAQHPNTDPDEPRPDMPHTMRPATTMFQSFVCPSIVCPNIAPSACDKRKVPRFLLTLAVGIWLPSIPANNLFYLLPAMMLSRLCSPPDRNKTVDWNLSPAGRLCSYTNQPSRAWIANHKTQILGVSPWVLDVVAGRMPIAASPHHLAPGKPNAAPVPNC